MGANLRAFHRSECDNGSRCYDARNPRPGSCHRGAGKHRSVKHPNAKRFEPDFLLQVPIEARQNRTGNVRVNVHVWYLSRRQDLDCALIYDLLQKAGVIRNDRQVIEKYEFAAVDKTNPCVLVELMEIS